jgi:hypothetical protein
MAWDGNWSSARGTSVCNCVPKVKQAAAPTTQPTAAPTTQPTPTPTPGKGGMQVNIPQSPVTPVTTDIHAMSPEDYLKQFTHAELQHLSSDVTVVPFYSAKVADKEYVLSTAKLDLTNPHSKRIFVLIPTTLIGSLNEFQKKGKLAVGVKVDASPAHLIRNLSVIAPDLPRTRIGPEWQTAPFAFVATSVEG